MTRAVPLQAQALAQAVVVQHTVIGAAGDGNTRGGASVREGDDNKDGT